MAKTAQTQPTNNDQSFAYAVGQDIAVLKVAVENLTHNQQGQSNKAKILKIVLPAVRDQSEYGMSIDIPIPAEYQWSFCVEHQVFNDYPSMGTATLEKTLTKSLIDVEQVIYYRKIMDVNELNSPDIDTVTISQEKLPKRQQAS